MDEQRRLQSFLLWAFSFAAICALAYLALALALHDRGLSIIAAIDTVLVFVVLIARREAGRGNTSRAAAIFSVSVLIAILCVLPVFSYAWPILVLGSILAVTVVLPTLRDGALAAVIGGSFVVGAAATFVGVFLEHGPETTLQKSVVLTSTVAGSTLILVLLRQFVQRIRGTLAEVTTSYESEQLARALAERRAEQTRRLHDTTSQLSRALPKEELAGIVLEQGMAMAGADTAALWLVEDGELRLLRAINYAPEIEAKYARMPLDMESPVAECVRRREAVWLTTRTQYADRFPNSEARSRALVPDVQLSIASLPLETEDRVVGVISYAFFVDRVFDESDRAALLTLSHHCAQALETVRLLELARAGDRRKDEFLALLGHELRNPLAPIATAIEVMKLRGVPGGRELPIMERQVRHLIGLVDDLLDVSRVTRGKIHLETKKVDVATVIADAVEMTAPLMEKHAHSLTIDVERDRFWADADQRRLAQVISNLLTNAARYTKPGGVIRLSAREEMQQVLISVEDNGSGIDPALIPSLFEPFAQGEQPIDRASGGLGLGLMLVKSLIELHGGSVTAHSEGVGKGSRFTVSLPLADESFEETTPTWLPPADGSLRQRVLVVDDNRDAANTLGELLEAYGCEVAVAFDGPEALEVAQEFRPTVAILDIGLPVMDGYELCRRLRAQVGVEVRMLSLSGYGQDQDRDRSVDAGFAAHLVKPIDATALVAALELSSSRVGVES